MPATARASGPKTLGEFPTAKSQVSLDFQCAVKGVLFPVGANPTRQLSLQPEAPGAVQGGNELD